MKAEIILKAGGEERFTEERCFIAEMWNDSRDPEVSIALARVQAGEITELHRLAVDERYVILSGRGMVEVEGLDPAHVGPGDIVLIPAGKTQRIANRGTEDLVFFCICTPRFEPRHYSS